MYGLIGMIGEYLMMCDICGKDLEKTTECAWTSCPLNWNESRIDIVGQNGPTGEHYEELDNE